MTTLRGSATVEWNGDELYDAIVDSSDEAGEKSTDVMAKDAKLLAPVRTGALQDAIESFGKVDDFLYEFGVDDPDVDYAFWVEIGTRIRKGVRFLANAAAHNVDLFPRLFKEALSDRGW